MKSKLVMIAMTILGIASPGQAQELKSGIDKANMDLSVKPGDDFYEYSAGSWLKNHPLDAVHPMNGAFTDLEDVYKRQTLCCGVNPCYTKRENQ